MLEYSFVHLPGIGPDTEARLWAQGLRSWKDLAAQLPVLFGPQKAGKLATALAESQSAHARGELSYFRSRFKGAEIWRLLPSFLSSAARIAYLDIETTGLGFPPQCHSTTIAVLFDGELYCEHEPRRKRELLERINLEADLLVTFNGGTFDLPFLRREWNLSFAQTHLDLRYWLARLGFKGGLKKIQKSFLHLHQRNSMDIDGYDAVRLWQMHLRGVPRALETLLTYNAEDTIILESLVHCGLSLEAERRAHLRLPTYQIPAAPSLSTSVCPKVYQLLRGFN